MKKRKNKPKNSNAKLLLGGAAGLLLIFCICCGGTCFFIANREPGTNVSKGDDGDEDATESGGKVHYKVTAEALCKEVTENVKAAQKKYRNKRVEVTSEVIDVVDRSSSKWIELKGRPGEENVNSVRIHADFASKEAGKAFRLSLGQKVKVTGKIRDELDISEFAINMDNCSIAEQEPSRLVKITSAELAKRCDGQGDKGVDELEVETNKHGWIISGTVQNVSPDENKYYYFVTLNGASKTQVRLRFNYPHGKDLPKKGQNLEASSRSMLYWPKTRELEFTSIFLSAK